jgi:hypothetical protein
MSTSVMMVDQAAAITSVAVWASGLSGTSWVALFDRLRNPRNGSIPYAMSVVNFFGMCFYVWSIVAAFMARTRTTTSPVLARQIIYAAYTSLKIGLGLSLTTFALFTAYCAFPTLNEAGVHAAAIVPAVASAVFVVAVEIWINLHNIVDEYFDGDTPVNNMTVEQLQKVLRDFSDRCTMLTTVAVWAAGLSGAAWVGLINTLLTTSYEKTAFGMALLVYLSIMFYVVCISLALLSRMEGNEGELLSSKYAKIEWVLLISEWSLKIGLMCTVAVFTMFVQYMARPFMGEGEGIAIPVAPAVFLFISSVVALQVIVSVRGKQEEMARMEAKPSPSAANTQA